MTDPVFLFDPDTDDVPVNGDGLNAGWTITLPASVKRHALGAMRLAEGDGLSLTDGRGLCVKTPPNKKIRRCKASAQHLPW